LRHIASHFSVKPRDGTIRFSLLGEGQLLWMQLKKLRFSGVDLLTLSACDTASGGKDADGREVESFAELAQRQGAGAVMATLWPVADKSTPRLMSLFYRERQAADGLSKAEALRRAQLALLRGADGVQAQVLAGTGERGSRSDEKPEGGAASGAADAKVPFAHPFFWAPSSSSATGDEARRGTRRPLRVHAEPLRASTPAERAEPEAWRTRSRQCACRNTGSEAAVVKNEHGPRSRQRICTPRDARRCRS
jgi:hypothetical protein